MLTTLQPFPRFWLIALWLLWAILLFGGFLFGPADKRQRMPKWSRLASSAMLVLASWSWFAIARSGEVGSFALWLALGMSLGFVGDLSMAGVLPNGRSVLGGMAAFGLGHVAYIIGIWQLSNQLGLGGDPAGWGSLLVWWMLGGIGWYFIVYRGQKPSTLHKAALPYALLLASTAGIATELALQHGQFIWLALGAALFLLSDLILAAELFNDAYFPQIGDVIWFTYGSGQMLIVFAVATAAVATAVYF
jgi:YhhN family